MHFLYDVSYATLRQPETFPCFLAFHFHSAIFESSGYEAGKKVVAVKSG